MFGKWNIFHLETGQCLGLESENDYAYKLIIIRFRNWKWLGLETGN